MFNSSHHPEQIASSFCPKCFGGLCQAWRALDMRDVTSCRESVEKLITAFVDNTLPSSHLHNCLLAPHRGPVQLNSDIFSPYLLFRDFWEETKGFQSQTPWSGSWLSASQCGHCFRTIAAQASQECVHEIIRWERSVVEAFRFGTLKDGPQCSL